MNADCLIEARDVWAGFDTAVILREVNLCVHRGEVMALIGRSGSGKTTLLRLALGLRAPLRGEVHVFGRPPKLSARTNGRVNGQGMPVQNRYGVLFQAGALFSALSVFDNVALPLRELKVLPGDMIRRLVMRKLALVEIDAQSAAKMPAELSGGMIKRVALARALALDPELLFLDEPTSGLDPDRAHDFVLLIESLRRQLHLTVLMASHDVDTVMALADRVAVIEQQRIVAVGPLAEIVRNPDPFIQGFFMGRNPVALRERQNLRADTRPAATGD